MHYSQMQHKNRLQVKRKGALCTSTDVCDTKVILPSAHIGAL